MFKGNLVLRKCEVQRISLIPLVWHYLIKELQVVFTLLQLDKLNHWLKGMASTCESQASPPPGLQTQRGGGLGLTISLVPIQFGL